MEHSFLFYISSRGCDCPSKRVGQGAHDIPPQSISDLNPGEENRQDGGGASDPRYGSIVVTALKSSPGGWSQGLNKLSSHRTWPQWGHSQPQMPPSASAFHASPTCKKC